MDDPILNPGKAQYGSERRSGNRRATDNAEPITVTIESAAKQKYSYDAKQYRLERSKYRLEKKAYCVARCTMIFLIVYTVLTGLLAYYSVKSNGTAKETLHIAYRPRIIIAGLGPSVTTKPGQPGVNFLEDGRIRMNSNISNVGPLTARNVRYFTFWEIIGQRGNAKRIPYSEHNEPFGHPKTILPKIAGFGDGDAFFTDVLTPEQIKTVSSPGVWVEFSVLITYDDDFGDAHGTEYCDMFVIEGPQDICPWNTRND